MARFTVLAAWLLCAYALADVDISSTGFATRNVVEVAAPPEAVWAALIEPARYWSPDHSWSGDASRFSLEARAGGCFCESLPDDGSVEHMRVVMVQPRTRLRLAGALGPLQSEGLAGALTWELEPAGSGTRITQTYSVGGHMQFDRNELAPVVDGVVREQLERLAALFDP